MNPDNWKENGGICNPSLHQLDRTETGQNIMKDYLLYLYNKSIKTKGLGSLQYELAQEQSNVYTQLELTMISKL